jgi:hypothetical protein
MDGIFICGIVFYAIFKIIELFVRQKERKLMIAKMSELSPEMLQSQVNSLQSATDYKLSGNHFSMLRLGGLALGIGAGWILGWVLYWIQASYVATLEMQYRHVNLESSLIASASLCAGIALIIVYLIERKAIMKSK